MTYIQALENKLEALRAAWVEARKVGDHALMQRIQEKGTFIKRLVSTEERDKQESEKILQAQVDEAKIIFNIKS